MKKKKQGGIEISFNIVGGKRNDNGELTGSGSMVTLWNE